MRKQRWYLSRRLDTKMKKMSMLIALVAVLSGACNETVDPTDPLYRTWQQTQTQYNDGRIVTLSNPSGYDIVTFRTTGMILYGANGRYAACCSPNRFRRKGDALDFVDVDAVPVPPVDNKETCYVLNCSGYGSSWQILALTDKQLILKTHYGTATYQPYP